MIKIVRKRLIATTQGENPWCIRHIIVQTTMTKGVGSYSVSNSREKDEVRRGITHNLVNLTNILQTMNDDGQEEKVDNEDEDELQDTGSNLEQDEDSNQEEEEDLDSKQHANDEGSVGEEDESLMETDERADDTDNVDEEDDELTVKSEMADDEVSTTSKSKASVASSSATPRKKRTPSKAGSGSGRKGRTPSVAGLTIPFRTVKKAMKLDPDIPIVQNEAAIMTTIAAESFLKSLARKSHRNAKNRGRNTIRYEDVAEARTQNSSLSFLEPLLP